MDVNAEIKMQPNNYSTKNWNFKSMLFDSGKLLGGSQVTKELMQILENWNRSCMSFK